MISLNGAIRLRVGRQHSLEKWERGERVPEGPTRAYLTVIERNPTAVIDALYQTSKY
jgi:DNA-binding transcriptional regulator YiaG